MYAFKTHFISSETAALGVGDIDEGRMQKAIKMIVDSYQLPNAPARIGMITKKIITVACIVNSTV